LFIFLAMDLIFDTKINQMKYPLTKAELKLKAKLENKKKVKERKVNRTIKKTLTYRYQRTMPEHDYMKYWRVIRFWAMTKYGVRHVDLDMLFFLYSEPYFNKTQFEEFNEIFSWDKGRFSRLIDLGWIHVWRKESSRGVNLYELTRKARLMVADVYNKLNGEEIDSDIFGKDPTYSQKVYRNYIKKLSDERKQELRRAQLSRGTSPRR
jgi:hypothetical protein